MIMKRARTSNPSSTSYCNKRRRSSDPQVVLPTDIFQPILERLPLKDLAHTKSVSSSWNHTASSVNSRIQKAPWLTLPSEEEEQLDGRSSDSCRFKNIEENIIYTMNQKTTSMLLNFPCIGSSLGWLILFDVSTFRPLLFNPFTGNQITNLPSLQSLFNKTKIDDLKKDSIRRCMIPKAILTADPELDDDYSIVLICIDQVIYNKIGSFKKGDESWTELSSIKLNVYEDIICFNNKLYAIISYSYSIHSWDLQNMSPENRTVMEPSFLNQQDFSEYDPFIIRCYLVESEGEILLAERLISEKMEDIVHTTKLFTVYKLNSDNNWVVVDSLGDRSLFLGGNHSVSVSTEGFKTCRRNLIYFTDDFWERMTEEWCEYGQDNGMYSLEDGSCSPVYEFDSVNVQPLPCWIVPN